VLDNSFSDHMLTVFFIVGW